MNQDDFKVIFEIGVGQINTCRTIKQIERGVKVVMFEPNPDNYKELSAVLSNRPNVKIHNIALSDFNGETEMVLDGDSSYLTGVASPSSVSLSQEETGRKKRVKVPVMTLDAFDMGDIDLLLLDTEGSEFNILSKMISRPRAISIETEMHNSSVNYTNPNLDKIKAWMAENGYIFQKQDDADSWYVKVAGTQTPVETPFLFQTLYKNVVAQTPSGALIVDGFKSAGDAAAFMISEIRKSGKSIGFYASADPEKIVDDSVHFVMLDPSHDFSMAKKEIFAWWPKIRFGGVVAGTGWKTAAVEKAVLQMAAIHESAKITADNDCWIVQK